ncbi:hypothetical protein IW262DRAFT_1464712 [Armillaria fumosa]|nr:hypothetical protein IW262DRAFT_1464712 [Armillaria fumosa]
MRDTLGHLHDMQPSVFNIMNHPITQVNNIDSPDLRSNTFAILEPLNDSALDLITPVVDAWYDTTVVKYFCTPFMLSAENVFDGDRLSPCDGTQGSSPYLDATIVRI